MLSGVESVAQGIRKASHCSLSCPWILGNQRAHRIQGVEEEVGIEL